MRIAGWRAGAAYVLVWLIAVIANLAFFCFSSALIAPQGDHLGLAVVDRNDPGRILGYLGRISMMLAQSRHQEKEEVREKASLSDLLPIGSQTRQE